MGFAGGPTSRSEKEALPAQHVSLPSDPHSPEMDADAEARTAVQRLMKVSCHITLTTRLLPQYIFPRMTSKVASHVFFTLVLMSLFAASQALIGCLPCQDLVGITILKKSYFKGRAWDICACLFGRPKRCYFGCYFNLVEQIR